MYARQELPDDDLYRDEPDAEIVGDEYEPESDYFADPELQKLADILHFTPEELALNRAGYLTPRQARQLERELRQMYWIIIGIISFTAFGMGALALVHWALLFIPIGLMIAAAVIAFVYREQRENLAEAEVDWSRVKLGWLSFVTKSLFGESNQQTAYFNNNKLGAPRDLYRAMQPNQYYRVYFARVRLMPGYRVLSMEPEGSSKPKAKRDKTKRG